MGPLLRQRAMSGEPRHPLVLPVLATALLAFSASAILVRLAPSVPASSAAFWRCALVALLLAPTLLRLRLGGLRLRGGGLRPRDGGLILLAGLFLALHFWTWFTSLKDTSVLRSTVLVCLSPAWAAIFEWIFLKERPSSRYWLGLALAVGGVAAAGLVQEEQGAGAGWGEALALLAGALAAAYMVIGREVRPRLAIGPYGSLVSGASAGWLLILGGLLPVLQGSAPTPLTGWGAAEWLALVGMAAGPQLFGHIGLNFAVRYLPAGVVALVVLLEPAGAGLMAGFVLDEWPGSIDLFGAIFVLIGLFISTAPGARPQGRTT